MRRVGLSRPAVARQTYSGFSSGNDTVSPDSDPDHPPRGLQDKVTLESVNSLNSRIASVSNQYVARHHPCARDTYSSSTLDFDSERRSTRGPPRNTRIRSGDSRPRRVPATYADCSAGRMGHHQSRNPSRADHRSILRLLRISRRNSRRLDPEVAECTYSIHPKVGRRIRDPRIYVWLSLSLFRWPPQSWGSQWDAGTPLRPNWVMLRDPLRPCASNLFCHQNALGSLGNPSVHSLSVTLGNHAVHDFQTYNWPCPDGHLPICGMDARDPYPGSSPQRSAGSVAARCRNSR
jgi:hypothetical protein